MSSRRRPYAALALVLPLVLTACDKAATTATTTATTTAATTAGLPSGPATDLADNATGPAPSTSATRATPTPDATPNPARASGPADPSTAGAGSAPTGSGGKGGSACSLITEHEAALAIGADPGPGDETTSHGASSCVFGAMPALVSVNYVPSNGAADFANLKTRAVGAELTPIAGIGDEAFTASAGPSASVWFRKGDALVAIVVAASGGRTSSADGARTLALLAANRL